MSRSDHYYTEGHNADRMMREAIQNAEREGRTAIIHHHRAKDECPGARHESVTPNDG